MNDDQGSQGIGEKATPWKEGVKEKAAPVQGKAQAAWDKTRTAASNVKEAVTGFVDEAKRQDLQGSVKEAIHKTGETTREVAQAAKDEVEQTRETAQGGGKPSSSGTTSQIDTTSY